MATTEQAQPGARLVDGGVRFRLFSGCAHAIELCLFDADDRPADRHWLESRGDGTWETFVPGCAAGQRYGYRVHGPFEPGSGLLCNPAKLLIDPYARQLSGRFRWSPEVFGLALDGGPDTRDSAAFVPKSVVTGPDLTAPENRPQVPATETLIYELNLRGFTMRHPALSDAERGTCRGLRHGAILDYLKALGITSVELMPVFAFLNEHHLFEKGLRNYWGYNTINFFAPSQRYVGNEGPAAFRAMVDAIHEAGLEVILDVAYNHTAEGDGNGPTVSFRGIDNLAYYRTHPEHPDRYINDTGCGNTLNVDHPRVQEMVVASLHYWVESMGVDGFRFDLATALSRTRSGFTPHHPLMQRIVRDPVLGQVKLIAEPWDIGPGGYQLGGFPGSFAEWNDRYRDTVRRFWRGDRAQAADLARRLHGSADLFEAAGRSPQASVNYVTSHDGYTLADLVSYEQRHNHANGEDNRDGHRHNFSRNYGVEGPTEDPAILAVRRRQRLNLLATLLFSQGIPMLLAGDEFGNSQQGNNNAYAQDNDTGWLDWERLEADPDFQLQVRQMISLRRALPALRRGVYLHGEEEGGRRNIEWLAPDGTAMIGDWAWTDARGLSLVLRTANPAEDVAVLINAARQAVTFHLPARADDADWTCRFASGDAEIDGHGAILLAPLSIACATAG